MRKVIVDTSERLQQIGPTALQELESLHHRMRLRGTRVIDMGRYAPDVDIDVTLHEAMISALAAPEAFRTARPATQERFRKAAAEWFAKRFGVRIGAQRGVLPTAGIKHAIHHLALALVNPGDPVGVPDPAYPHYRTAVTYVGGRILPVVLRAANDYLPNLAQLEAWGDRPRLLVLNYPHNPTSRPPDRSFYVDVVRWANRHNVIIVQDFAYGELYYDGEPPISILSIPGARRVAVELHSFSFTYNLPGLKLGFAAGHPEMLAALEQAQLQLSAGPVEYALNTGIAAFEHYDRIAAASNREFTVRRQTVAAGLDRLGWTYRRPTAGAFFWVPVPRRRDDVRLARRLLKRANVLVAPGSAFGEGGEGFLRFSVALRPETIRTAFERVGRLWPDRLKQMRKPWGSSASSE